jgi:flagellar biosynthesis/type III secretory pathway M-ring protein FliF/YscJ
MKISKKRRGFQLDSEYNILEPRINGIPETGGASVNTIFILLICLYVTVKLIFFVAIYIGTKKVERKALEKRKQFEAENQVIEVEARTPKQGSEKKYDLTGNRFMFMRNDFFD